MAFAGGLSLLWKVVAGIGGAGLVVSFAMQEIPMHSATDDNWALETIGPDMTMNLKNEADN